MDMPRLESTARLTPPPVHATIFSDLHESQQHSESIRYLVPPEEAWLPKDTLSAFFLLAVLSLPHIYFLFRYWKMQRVPSPPQPPFPFMDLPPELRDMVYEYLLEDPYYPPRPPCAKHTNSGALSYLLPYRRSASPDQCSMKKQCNWIFLACKQTHWEYFEMLAKKKTLYLSVSPANFPKALAAAEKPVLETVTVIPGTSTYRAHVPTNLLRTSSSFTLPPRPTKESSSPTTATSPSTSIWTINPNLLSKARKCNLTLTLTSSMLGAADPRTMTPASLPLAQQIAQELCASAENMRELSLHVKAIGDPLWNPLWVWYHASMAFVGMGEEGDVAAPASAVTNSTSTVAAAAEVEVQERKGPKVNQIEFSLDTWSPGENHLARNKEGRWAWYCVHGHCVGSEAGRDMTVREFCARLYWECRVCRPELDSDDEGEE